ncbi:peptidoglycan glycosyltransferase FtsW [Chachezhania sediminis]|uniref:peptidoglycan glycosyltransferase FtsW n=1 Tax=Chachezhania sediminis TaxID=2599291 RepID=UPI00131DFE04|nr:putative peptidoglycan glycosyltransferase FtsW [Chachezhania sediminis]
MTDMVYGAVPRETGEAVLPKWWRTLDKWTLVCIFLLFGVGLLLGLAASVPLAERNGLDPFYYVQRQAMFGSAAMVVMLAVSMLSPDMVRRVGALGFLISFLALVALPFLGTDFGKGAIRWYSIGFGSVQPSEFLKPGFVVVAAWLLAAAQQVGGPPGKTWSFILCAAIVGMLVAQPDFGQASLILFGWAVMYFIAGAPMLLLVAMAGITVLGGAFAYTQSAHVARRIDGFLATELDPTTQLGFAANAIRSGGLFGVGVGEGQVKWSLPDAHTDFIIAVAAEEYGLVLVLVVIALYMMIVLRSLGRLMRERDPFIRLAGAGLACTFGVQAMINMGVAARLLPAKGMTLPFVSYGGSSLIAGGIAMGMLLAFTRSRAQGQIGDILRGHRR